MALSPGKSNFICLVSNLSDLSDEIFLYKNVSLKNTSVNEILGVIIDRELKFDKHIYYIYKKSGNRINGLTRMANILNRFQNNILVKSFNKGQFNYCPLL